MKLHTEPIGSIPQPPELLAAIQAHIAGKLSQAELEAAYERALKDTLHRFEATGSPVLTDGEQTQPSLVTYPLNGMTELDPSGVVIPLADGHIRQLPCLTQGPFRYRRKAVEFFLQARRFTGKPLKQAVISASALSLLYPATPIPGYSREVFLADLLNEHEADIRACLEAGAHKVQLDFTDALLSLKLDPSQGLLRSFIALNNQVLDRFTPEERARLGVHVCPRRDHQPTHSAEVDYTQLLPLLFELNLDNFYLQYARQKDKRAVLKTLRTVVQPGQRVFLGVIDVLNPRVETPEEVQDLLMEAAEYVPAEQLGTTDDCGFAPFADDTSTSRELAFAKIKARLAGTRLAKAALG